MRRCFRAKDSSDGGARATRLATTLLAAVAALVVVFPGSGGAAPAAVIDLTSSSTVLVESWQPGGIPNDPNRCISVHFLQFPAVPGATTYSAIVLNHVLGVNQPFSAGPPYPHDSYTVSVGGGLVHTFTAPGGTHRIVLGSDSSGSGCTAAPRFSVVSVTTNVDNPPPTAAFTWRESASDPFTIEFDASGSTDDESVDIWEWSFGDGMTGSGETTSNTYDGAGKYPVTLTVTDNEGATDTETIDVQIGNPRPVASFSWRASESDPLTIEFDGSGSTDDEGIDTWVWDFGDEQTGSEQQTSHTYDAPGRYPVTLTVTDSDGATDTDTQDVNVASCPLGSAERKVAGRAMAAQVSSFAFEVTNTAGKPVRNVRIQVQEGCRNTTVVSEPTNRNGFVELDVSHEDADPRFTMRPLYGTFTPQFVTHGASTDGTTLFDFTLENTCLGRPVTVLGSNLVDEGDVLELYSADIADALAGNDLLTPASGETGFVVCGGQGEDRILIASGSVLADVVDGGDDKDTVETGAGNDRITGGGGPDVVLAGDDDDTVDGGTEDDTIAGGSGCDGLVGGEGFDTLRGDGGVNAPASGGTGCAAGGLDGGAGNDRILGGPERDLLTGGPGCDGILGGPGADTITGGDDGDSPLPVGCDQGGLDGGSGQDLVDGNSGIDTIEGAGGNDQLRGGTEPDRIAGGADCDLILGEGGDDTIDGGPGNDNSPGVGCAFAGGLTGGIDGGPGNDTATGGAGADDIRGGVGCDRLLGGSGNSIDTISGGNDHDSPTACTAGGIFGEGGPDVLDGADGADYVEGGDGGDRITGSAGMDELHGGDGPDDIQGDGSSIPSPDRIFGDGGRDTITGGDERSPNCRSGDVIFGGDAGDTIHGGGGGDAIVGDGGWDELFGEAGCDDLYGGDGDDVLEGGANPDTATELLWGEAGNDWIRGGPSQDALQGGPGIDNLGGGSGVDVLEGGVTQGLPNPPSPGTIAWPTEEGLVPSPDLVEGGPDGDSCARRPLDILLSCDRLPIAGNMLWDVFVARLRPQP